MLFPVSGRAVKRVVGSWALSSQATRSNDVLKLSSQLECQFYILLLRPVCWYPGGAKIGGVDYLEHIFYVEMINTFKKEGLEIGAAQMDCRLQFYSCIINQVDFEKYASWQAIVIHMQRSKSKINCFNAFDTCLEKCTAAGTCWELGWEIKAPCYNIFMRISMSFVVKFYICGGWDGFIMCNKLQWAHCTSKVIVLHLLCWESDGPKVWFLV